MSLIIRTALLITSNDTVQSNVLDCDLDGQHMIVITANTLHLIARLLFYGLISSHICCTVLDGPSTINVYTCSPCSKGDHFHVGMMLRRASLMRKTHLQQGLVKVRPIRTLTQSFHSQRRALASQASLRTLMFCHCVESEISTHRHTKAWCTGVS